MRLIMFYLKEKKGCIREVLILAIDKQDGAIVRIKGKISPNDGRLCCERKYQQEESEKL